MGVNYESSFAVQPSHYSGERRIASYATVLFVVPTLDLSNILNLSHLPEGSRDIESRVRNSIPRRIGLWTPSEKQ